MSFAGVSISKPTSGAVTNSPMRVVATATPPSSSTRITGMQVYVDGRLAYQKNSSSIDAYISVAQGSHNVVVKAWDSGGHSSSAQRTVKGSGSGVFLTSPGAESTIVSGSTRLQAKAYSTGSISGMKVYNDGEIIKETQTASLDFALSLPQGTHYLNIKAWDSRGNVFVHPLTVTSGSSSSSPVNPPSTVTEGSQANIPSGAVAKKNIDQMTGWEHCDTCAGIGGNGPQTAYSLTQFLNSPSLDGNSAVFWLGGSTPYSNAIWWKQLGGNDNYKHFVYDLYFYVKNLSAAQALEFDVNQSAGGLKYIFGTECGLIGGKGWRVWDTQNKAWKTTSASCSPKANSWNHLTWEFERVGNQTRFIAVTLNGYRQTINRYYYAKSSSVHEINVAFQMDGNVDQTDYSVWLDKVHLFYW
jgi:Bacterial Ig domain